MPDNPMPWEPLKHAAESIGQPHWRPMLRYVAALHQRSTRQPRPPFPHPWEEIGPGYCYGPAFGHWDLIHQVFDVLPHEPLHARMQILNNLAAQEPDGLVPGSIWMRDETPRWDKTSGHPPVWPIALDEFPEPIRRGLVEQCHEALLRQIHWFETCRKAEPTGFYYTDILNHKWESGIDEGIRFLGVQQGPLACVDATSHMFAVYETAARWSRELGKPPEALAEKAEALRAFIRNELFAPQTGFFHDIWAARDPALRCLAFEGMWPVVVGAATDEQADRVIHEHLLNPQRFFTEHPIATVSLDDPRFELRMWRGPAWNSMTYWAARGCMRYGFPEEAARLLERALDCSAKWFGKTGTVWEFYHPQGGAPTELARKPHTTFNAPCRDYLGHNPLMAMAALYEKAVQ